MKEARYDENFFVSDFLIASRDEIEIEAELAELLEKGELPAYAESCRRALRKIDKLRADGQLEQESKRLARLMKLPTEEERANMTPKSFPIDSMLANFRAGMASPNPIQRKRFLRAYERIKHLDLCDDEIQTWLPILEKAPKRNGHRRRIKPPWRNDDASLKRMRDLVLGGSSVVEASKIAAREENHSATNYLANRAATLRKRYKLKMALREESS